LRITKPFGCKRKSGDLGGDTLDWKILLLTIPRVLSGCDATAGSVAFGLV
jgi:hypothetical protein